MPPVKSVGEPCAREPHARFDAAAGGNQHQSGQHASTRRAVPGASRRPYLERRRPYTESRPAARSGPALALAESGSRANNPASEDDRPGRCPLSRLLQSRNWSCLDVARGRSQDFRFDQARDASSSRSDAAQTMRRGCRRRRPQPDRCVRPAFVPTHRRRSRAGGSRHPRPAGGR